MSTRLRIGMGQPYALRITVPSSADFDPTAPTAVTFKVQPPTGSLRTWPGSITAQTSVSATAVYPLASDGSDIDVLGTWHFWVQWTVAGVTPGPRSETATFLVVSAAQV